MSGGGGVFFSAIYARDENGLMGVDGKLPWRCPIDLAWFQHHTRQKKNGATAAKVVIMGRRTWDSLPSANKPLPDRMNIVVSRQPLDPTRHMFRMLLDEPYFSQIKRGEKTIEGRLSTPERSHIDTGDTILFVKSTIEGKKSTNESTNESTNDTFVRTVASIGHYQSFLAMLTKEGIDKVLPGVHSVNAGVHVYRKFYTAAAEANAGVLAIRLQPQPPASQLIQEATHSTFRTHSLKHALLLAQLLIAQPTPTKTNPTPATVTAAASTATMASTATTATTASTTTTTTTTTTAASTSVNEKDTKEGFGPSNDEGGMAPIFVIGGSRLLSEAFEHPGLERILETRMQLNSSCLTSENTNETIEITTIFNKPVPSEFVEVDHRVYKQSVFLPTTQNATTATAATAIGDATMQIWVRRRAGGERAYLNLLAKVMTDGVAEVDRTGVGTISTFGEMFRCDLCDGFPLLTTKRVFWKGVVEELLWFLRGETNVAKLHEADVHFWDGNLNSEHTKNLKLPPGELGPVYGRQWRAFGPDGVVCSHGCLVPGVDQMKRLVDDIRASPNSRRLIVTAWNPMVIDKVALPSCHCFMQFEVKNKQLSCLIYLRSNDLFLGAPLNIASYALLTHILAAMTGLRPGTLVYTVGNAHIYKNHLNQVKQQLARSNRPLPTLTMDLKIIEQIYPAASGSNISISPNFGLLSRKHFVLSDYYPLSTISATMAV
jgi:thymidylate synthase